MHVPQRVMPEYRVKIASEISSDEKSKYEFFPFAMNRVNKYIPTSIKHIKRGYDGQHEKESSKSI